MSNYKGTFVYEIPTSDFVDSNFPFINKSSFKILRKTTWKDNIKTIVSWYYEFEDKQNDDGLYLNGTITNTTNMNIINFDKIPLSRANRQFLNYKGRFPLNLPTLLINTDISGCFDSTFFNGDISLWIFKFDLVKNLSLLNLFARSTYNNILINNLNVSGITQLNSMFLNNIVFNQPLNKWNTSNIGDMQYLFCGASSFNQNIGNWNVSVVRNMSYLFCNALSFNQDISTWDISNVVIMECMLDNSALSVENYDKLLLTWSSLSKLNNGVIFGVKNLKYSSKGKIGRDILINKYKWNFVGDCFFNNLTDIYLSSNTILENKEEKTFIGKLTTTNMNNNNTYTIDDNINFCIIENELYSNTVFNYEKINNYNIAITINDMFGCSYTKNFNIIILNNNDFIEDIILSNNKLKFNVPINTFIGFLTAIDEDKDETYTYKLENEIENFKIVGNELLSNVLFNEFKKTSYDLIITATNNKQDSKTKIFKILMVYVGVFRYGFESGRFSENYNFILNNDNSFIKLNKNIFNKNNYTTISYEYEFYDNLKTNDGLYMKTNLSTEFINIENFEKIPISRKGFQFLGFKGSFPFNKTDIPTLLPYSNIEGCFDNTKYDGVVSRWNVNTVKNNSLLNLFARSTYNNSVINNLNISKITQLNSFFINNEVFNQPLNKWNTSNIGDIQYMFCSATSFNQDITMWNMSNVLNMSYTFCNAISFNQNISLWDVSKVVIMQGMLNNCGLSLENYDKLLLSWSVLPKLNNNVIFGVKGLKYSLNGKKGRDILINKYNWIISGDILVEN